MAGEARFEIKLIGHFCVVDRDSAEVHLKSRSARAILVALALEPRGLERGTLTALFWPEADTINAGNNMRQAIRSLRSAFGYSSATGEGVDPLLTANDRLELNPA
jgi:DNA-binding SARP family transcriptional activator